MEEEGCAYSFKRAVAHAEQLLVHINVMYLGERSPGGDVAGVSKQRPCPHLPPSGESRRRCGRVPARCGVRTSHKPRPGSTRAEPRARSTLPR